MGYRVFIFPTFPPPTTEAEMPTSKALQIRAQLFESHADPFLIAAEAIERSDRLYNELIRVQKRELSPKVCGSCCSEIPQT